MAGEVVMMMMSTMMKFLAAGVYQVLAERVRLQVTYKLVPGPGGKWPVAVDMSGKNDLIR